MGDVGTAQHAVGAAFRAEWGRVVAYLIGVTGDWDLAEDCAQDATAPTAAATDWVEIALLYKRLSQLVPSPVVALNHAVAVGMADGPAAGLRLVDQLEQSGALAGYHLLPATRADLLRQLGRNDQAAVAYRRARDLAPTEAERRYLTKRLAEVSPSK